MDKVARQLCYVRNRISQSIADIVFLKFWNIGPGVRIRVVLNFLFTNLKLPYCWRRLRILYASCDVLPLRYSVLQLKAMP